MNYRRVRLTTWAALSILLLVLAGLLLACDPNPIVPLTPTVGLGTAEPLRAVAYYPGDYAWLDFWPHWAEARAEMDADLDVVRDLGANAVRIFVHPSAFNYPQAPTADQLARFEEMLDLLDEHGLKAHVTLFDCWWSWEDIAGSRTWLAGMVEPYSDDPRIALWELQNAVDLRQELVRDWVRVLFPRLKQAAGSTPCTVSVADVEWLDDVKELTAPRTPDIYALHWTPPSLLSWTRPLPKTIDRALELAGGPDQLLVEFAASSFTVSESRQVAFYRDVLYYAGQKGLVHLAVWALNDLQAGSQVCGAEPAPVEDLYYGLYRLDGSAKLSAAVVADAYHDRFPPDPSAWTLLNGSFEEVNPDSGKVAGWWPWDEQWTGQLRFVQDCAVARSGDCSARLQGEPTMTVGLLHILGLPVEAGQHYTLQGYVRTEDLEGQTWLALSWFDAEENWLNADTRSQPISEPTLSTWTALRLDDVEPPPLAAYVQVFAQVYSGNPDSRVWFDDISIEER